MSEDAPHDPSTTPQPPPEAADASYPTVETLAELLPQYEMHGIVGVGGMGAVYKARQMALDRWVAIKVLPAAASQNAEDTDRFIKEARAMAKLVHPHIVAVFDFGQTYHNHLFLVMEYVEGNDLHRRTRAGEITPQRAREVIAQLCDALQFAHDHGVAHRDIKPANILITENWKVKVADFGLARDMTATPNADEPEYGTPDYTAPERLVVGAVVDHRADIYSLGVVIHEMLTGKTPTAAGKDAGKGLPEGFAGVISKCLMQDPDRRYQKATEVKVALLSATAENQKKEKDKDRNKDTAAGHATSSGTGADAATLGPRAPYPAPPSSDRPYRPSALAGAARILGPVGWGLASVAILGVLGWAIIRNKMQQEPGVSSGPANTQAGAGELALLAPPPPAPAPPQTQPDTAPAQPPPPSPPQAQAQAQPGAAMPPVTPATSPDTAPAVVAPAPPPPPPVLQAPATPLGQPYVLPPGPPGEVARFKGHTGTPNSVAILRDQRRIASAGNDEALFIWDARDQRQLLKVDPQIGDIARVVISRDDKRALLTSLITDQVAVVEIETGKVLGAVKVPHDGLGRAIFLPDDQEVLIGGTSSYQNLYRWQPGPGAALQPVTAWPAMAHDLVPMPDGETVLVTGQGRAPDNPTVFRATAGYLKPATGEILPWTGSQAPNYMNIVAVAPDAPQAAAIGAALNFFTWPALERTHSLPLETGQPRPRCIALGDKGRLVVGVWTDDSLRILEAAGGREVYRAATGEKATEMALSQDQSWAVLGTRRLPSRPGGGSEMDLILWRLPKLDTLMSPEEVARTAASQMPALAAVDADLAALRDRLQKDFPFPDAAERSAELRMLDSQYIKALRTQAALRNPTEQAAMLAEVELIGLGRSLPAEGMDVTLPPPLRSLRGIYRTQLAAVTAKEAQARQSLVQSIEAELLPVRQRREAAGDLVGVERVNLVLKSLLPQGGASSAPAPGPASSGPSSSSSGGPSVPPPAGASTAPGTPTKRPDRPGTVIAIQRAVKNAAPAFQSGGVSQIPAEVAGAVALAGGPEHAFALLADGQVRGWGVWIGKSVTMPGAVKNVVRLDSSASAALALRADGRVVAWGPDLVDNAVVWDPPGGRVVVDVCAGANATGMVICTDGSVHPVNSPTPGPPPPLGPVARLFFVPENGYCAVMKDGSAGYWGEISPPVTPLPKDLRDLACLSFGKGYAVSMQKDGTLNGWGTMSSDQRFRIRRFTGSIGVVHDYADRLFPVHRNDHVWELVANPNQPDFASEDRATLLEGRLRGCLDAVFTRDYVIGLKPQ